MNEKKTVIIQLMPFCNMKILFEICQPDFGNNLELKTTPTNGHKISIFSKFQFLNQDMKYHKKVKTFFIENKIYFFHYILVFLAVKAFMRI